MIYKIDRISHRILDNPGPPSEGAYFDRAEETLGGVFEHWLIELNSLEELEALVEKEGDLILSKGSITIYDSWNE